MMLSKALLIAASGLSSCSLVNAAARAATTTPPPTRASPLAERQIISSIGQCSTGTSGVVTPTPSAAVCGVAAVSNGGVTIISYTSGTNVQSLETCAATCLATTGCTNLYFSLNKYCNLHSGAETHVLNSGSIYTFYDATCFSCSALTNTATTQTSTVAATACTTNALGLASPQPSGAVCGVLAYSNGGTTIISYTSGKYILSVAQCKDICLTTVGCTNIYFAQGEYCNLHSGLETHTLNSGSPYTFYDSSCFICPSTCGQDGYAVPADATCNELAYSNGGTTIISYTSGTYVQSIDACSAICLQTTGCTNLYFDAGAYCNLHAGNSTAGANSGSPYQYYDVECFECTKTSAATISSTSSSTTSTSKSTAKSSSATTSSTISQATGTPWTSIETDTAKYNMAVSTTFTQSPQCTGLITQMAYHGTNLWENAINPVPTSTITTCYPSQFYSSVMAELNSVSLPAFSTLVCPSGWTANMWNETYGACCPSSFGVYAPFITDYPDRPFYYAACTSMMPASQVYELTSYDSTAYLTTIETTAPSTGTFVRINAFDGKITGVPTTTTTTSSVMPSSSTTACATPAATVSVTFRIKYAISDDYDDELISIVGSTDELGNWNVTNGLAMSAAFYTLSNPVWELTVPFNASDSIEYQYVHSYSNGTYNTTLDPHYNLTISNGCPSTQSVTDVWRG